MFTYLAISSCSNKNIEDINVCQIQKKDSFILKNMYTPRDICCSDSFLIVGDHNAEMAFSVFNISVTPPQLIIKYGTHGQGPNEFLFPEAMKKNGNFVTIFDRSLLKMKAISLIAPQKEMKTIPLVNHLFVGFNNVICVDDSLYIGLTYWDKNRFAIISGDLLIPLDIPYPNDGIVAPIRQKSLVYQGNLVKHPNKNKFVFASLYGKILEFYNLDVEKKDLSLFFSKNEIIPDYIPVEDTQEIFSNFTKKNITGYLHITTSLDYVYVLFSGKTVKDRRKNLSSHIEVYDWSGNHIRNIELDSEISAFCVDSNDTMIYGITYNETDSFLFYYDISKIDNEF